MRLILILLAASLFVTACGRKGPLRRMDEAPAEEEQVSEGAATLAILA